MILIAKADRKLGKLGNRSSPHASTPERIDKLQGKKSESTVPHNHVVQNVSAPHPAYSMNPDLTVASLLAGDLVTSLPERV